MSTIETGGGPVGADGEIDLETLIEPLATELGDGCQARIAAFRQNTPGPFLAPEDEAIAFCRRVAERAHHDQDRRTSDFARLTEGLLWQNWTHPSEAEGSAEAPTHPRGDAVAADEALRKPGAHVAVRGRFLHLKRFRYLPAGYETAPISSDGVYFLLFFKRPGRAGDHWPVTRLTARIVEDCDGEQTLAEISRHFEERTGRPEMTRRLVEQTLRLLADAGLITLVRRRP